MPIGTFHGLMAAMTPIGRRAISIRAASSSCTVTRGMSRSAYQRKFLAAPCTLPMPAASGMPCSMVARRPSSSAFASSASAQAYMTARRLA